MTEYLFRNPELLDEALDTAIDDHNFRSDDLEFTFAARVSYTQYFLDKLHLLSSPSKTDILYLGVV